MRGCWVRNETVVSTMVLERPMRTGTYWLRTTYPRWLRGHTSLESGLLAR